MRGGAWVASTIPFRVVGFVTLWVLLSDNDSIRHDRETISIGAQGADQGSAGKRKHF